MTLRLVQPHEMPTHFAMRQFAPEAGAFPLLLMFRVSSMHGVPYAPTDDEVEAALQVLQALPPNRMFMLTKGEQ